MYGLSWENVNLSRRVLTVPRSKNGESQHTPFNSVTLAALVELRKRGDGTGAVIRNLKSEPLAGRRHWFEPAICKAKVRAFSWHCLRHTFASRLVMTGVDLRSVQELMGNKRISMTVLYSHLNPRHTLSAVERLSGVVSEAPTDTKAGTNQTEQSGTPGAYVH
jgi:site-specific recombinase XerD